MRIYDGSRWSPIHLDYWKDDGDVRLEVLAWAVLREVEDQFFVRSPSLALVLRYLREVGPAAVLRKVRSRRAETGRNRKYLSVGIGRVADGADAGALVTFLAPNHPPCVDRLCVPAELTRSFTGSETVLPPPGRLLFADLRDRAPRFAPGMDGWSPFAGIEPDPITDELEEVLLDCLSSARAVETVDPGPVAERSGVGRSRATPRRQRPGCTLIGFGNYARTTLVPFLSRQVDVRTIHELDPCQIGPSPSVAVAWDTAPAPRESDVSDCWAIAGYHHLHAPLAVQALRRGKHAIVEKPLAVGEDELEELLRTMDEGHGAGIHVCFQRRYARYNDWIAEDVRGSRRLPIDYHCMVFEEPLPRRHWYRWPVSGSALTSNGCHWIDHFLFLNDYADPAASAVTLSAAGGIDCSIELANGAFFTMVLTSHGSARLGMQDVVDVRCEDRSARIVNGREYIAEGPQRIARRRRVRKLDAYERMYEAIGRRVAAGHPGDSRRSLEIPARITQSLERQAALA